MPKYTSAKLAPGPYGWTVHRDGKPMLLLSEPLTETEANALCFILNHEFSALTPPAATDGFVLVPREPTAEMIVAGACAVHGRANQHLCRDMTTAYKAMIAAWLESQK